MKRNFVWGNDDAYMHVLWTGQKRCIMIDVSIHPSIQIFLCTNEKHLLNLIELRGWKRALHIVMCHSHTHTHSHKHKILCYQNNRSIIPLNCTMTHAVHANPFQYSLYWILLSFSFPLSFSCCMWSHCCINSISITIAFVYEIWNEKNFYFIQEGWINFFIKFLCFVVVDCDCCAEF